MVPRLANVGSSFFGAYQYYCHDKNASTSKRVAWAETMNMLTDKVEKAWKVMAYTAKHQERLKEASGQSMVGAKLKKPVLAYSLAWHPEQEPDRVTMMEAARTSLQSLGLEEHEAMVVCHTDEPHKHVHIVANAVHPITGLVAKLKYTKRKLQDWAREFQQEEGTDYCPKRDENYQKRMKGMTTNYGDPVIINAWKKSNDAKGFAVNLEAADYRLEQGRKRLIVVDSYGKSHNPVRHLKGEGVRAKEFNARMKDWEPEVWLSEPVKQTDTSRSSQNRLIEFNQCASDMKTALLGRQHEELSAMTRKHEQELKQKRKHLANRYKITERQERIDAFTTKLEYRNLLQRLVQRLFLQHRLLTRALDELEAKQYNAKTHLVRSCSHLKSNHSRQAQSLVDRHTHEREQLKKRIESWRPRVERSSGQQLNELQNSHPGLHP